MMIFYLCSTLKEGLESFEISMTSATDYPHEVVFVIGFAPEESITILLQFEYFELFLDLFFRL